MAYSIIEGRFYYGGKDADYFDFEGFVGDWDGGGSFVAGETINPGDSKGWDYSFNSSRYSYAVIDQATNFSGSVYDHPSYNYERLVVTNYFDSDSGRSVVPVEEKYATAYDFDDFDGELFVDGIAYKFGSGQSVDLPGTAVAPPVPTAPPQAPAVPTTPSFTPQAPVLSADYLSFAPDAQFQRPFDATAKYFDYVDRYPLTLKTAFIADYNAGKAPSQALWGQQHWLAAGSKQGRVLEVVDGTEDINDYGAYVENYGTTLLDIYRASPDSNPSSESFKSLFNWGKDHYNSVGKAAGREIGGGVDWGAIVKQNFDLNTKWQDAKITDPSLTAFAYGYRNQNVIKSANGVQVGRDTQEKLTGQYVYGLGGNDVLTGTASDDLLHGGFGDDLIGGGTGGTDLVYGGPGKDVFRLQSGGTLNIRDFRKGTDFIQLGDGLTEAEVQLKFDGFNNTTLFMKGSETLASVYGTNPTDFSFAQQSEGIDNAFIA